MTGPAPADLLRVRRVVTGHDGQGRAVLAIDETMRARAPRPGQEACVVWATDQIPADNGDPADGAGKASGSTLDNGVVFRVVRYAPGTAGGMHRTRSLDYGVVLEGAIVLELDDGVQTILTAGDVLVQRGTVHRWRNAGSAPCTIAFVLIDAHAAPAEDA